MWIECFVRRYADWNKKGVFKFICLSSETNDCFNKRCSGHLDIYLSALDSKINKTRRRHIYLEICK